LVIARGHRVQCPPSSPISPRTKFVPIIVGFHVLAVLPAMAPRASTTSIPRSTRPVDTNASGPPPAPSLACIHLNSWFSIARPLAPAREGSCRYPKCLHRRIGIRLRSGSCKPALRARALFLSEMVENDLVSPTLVNGYVTPRIAEGGKQAQG